MSRFEDEAKGVQMIKDFERDLAERKDAYWARKVVFLVSFGATNSGPQSNLLSTMVAVDIDKDMQERYPGKSDFVAELIEDGDALVELLSDYVRD
jgi:hypothetical protein